MSENTGGAKVADLQKSVLDCIKTTLKKEKNPERTLTILRSRTQLRISLDKIGDLVGLGRERTRQIELGFVRKIAQALNLNEKEVRNILIKMPPLKTVDQLAEPQDAQPKVISVSDMFSLLCQHIVVLPSGPRIVKEPVRTLQVREEITPEESAVILQAMRTQGLIDGKPPWTIIQIIPEVHLPEYDSYSTRGK